MEVRKFLSRFTKRRGTYNFLSRHSSDLGVSFANPAIEAVEVCPTCGRQLTVEESDHETSTHNPHSCRLVNIGLREMGLSLDQPIRIEIFPQWGPLKGYYTPTKPYTIHVSQEAYSLFPEYIIFHETKHLVDCLTKGWSDENTPDPFARALCGKYGFPAPPSHVHYVNGALVPD